MAMSPYGGVDVTVVKGVRVGIGDEPNVGQAGGVGSGEPSAAYNSATRVDR
jgi:hypothetical protein